MFPNQIMNLIAGKVALGRIQSYMQVSSFSICLEPAITLPGGQPSSSLVSQESCACSAGKADLHEAWVVLSATRAPLTEGLAGPCSPSSSSSQQDYT